MLILVTAAAVAQTNKCSCNYECIMQMNLHFGISVHAVLHSGNKYLSCKAGDALTDFLYVALQTKAKEI